MKFFLRFASLLLLQFCFIYPVLLAQTPDSWTQKANFGGLGRLNAVGFNIGNKGYIGTGANATTAFSDIWEYDPSTDTWAQKADYGGGARRGAYAFVVGNKAYVGGGSNSAADEYPATASLWEYNSFANTWTQKASSGPLFYGSVAFSIDGKGYVITGGIASYSADNINFALTRRSSGNVAMYDPETDTWTNKARGPFDLAGAFGFTINGKGYVGGGTDNGGVIKKGFYEYNPSTDTWTAKADFAGDRAFGSPSFVSGNRGFVGLTGLVGAAQNLYEYNPASDTWTSRAVYPDGGTVGGAAFSIGNKGYIGTGSSKKTFYEYTSAETFTPATALKFDPSEDAGDNSRLNYVSVDNPFRGFQKEITVEFWMYAPSANMPFGSIMGQGSNNVDANWVWLMHPETNGTMTFYVSDGASFKTAKCNIIAGSWHHYAATSSAGSTKFYVDGNEVSFYTINGQQFNDAVGGGLSSGLLSNTNAVLHIGKDVRYETRNIGNNDPKNRYAVMTIDELRIWSRALCVDEIRHNKNVEINPAVQTGLQHYYSFNQGFVNANNPGETILRDLSGNNRNGELKNFSLYGTNSNWVASGFTSTGIYTLYDNSAAPITGVNNICMGTNTTLLNTRSGGKWLSSNTSVATINEITGLVTPISPGSTTITYTTNCNVSTLNFTVNALTTPTISGTGTIFLCSGSSTTLTASGGATYSWSPGGATTASVTVSPTVNTTYTVTATTAAGCSATTSRNVGIVNKPMVSAISNSPVSSGNTLQLDASGANTYSWSGPNGFTSSVQNPVINNVTAAATGTYTVTGANSFGCTNTATVNVTVSSLPATALKTDGVDDHITISNPFKSFEKEITVEFWMNTPTGKLAQGSIMGLSSLNVDGMDTDVWLMHPDLGGTNLDFYVNDAGTWRRATVPIIAGGWHHYVGVASEFGIKFYVDGVLKKTEAGINTGILRNANAIMQIGKDPRHTNFRFADMTIDEVRIWSRALCEAEIINNKNCELNPVGQDGLQQYYRFNQGYVSANNSTETSLTDLSGNNRHGVLSGFALNGVNSNWVASGSTNTGTCTSFSTPTAPITGTTTICGIGNTSTLSNAIAGGLWSSSNTSVATINANTGLVTALSEGNTTITYKNECGGISTILVRVVSTASPTITGPAGGTNACPGNTVTLTAPIAFANYQWFRDGVAVTFTTSTRTYNATVSGTYTATRISFGCTSALSNAITVTIADAIKPTITCPANQTLNLDASCKATLPDYRNLVTVSDNCTPTGSLVITQSPAAGSEVNDKGSMIVTLTVRDAAGNESTCTITIEKKDVTGPVVTCPAPIAVNAPTNTCGAVVTFTSPNATDNCGIIPFTSFRGGEPNQFQGALQDYLQLYTDGTWDDLQNTTLNKWIVEFNT
ncbi:LamG-like jellyroll fold domain-containing protein, partial [Sediminibacterium sp.]|uniref:LamG-like jellyroll fold domain-containing protein n=1 Tax=Sediminibacterium sp. TaxID=1917865 RepID=UPI003F71F2D6